MDMPVISRSPGFLERQLRERRVWIEQHGNVALTGDKLPKKLQSFALHVPRLVGKACDVSTGPGKARDDAGTQRVADGREYDRDGRSRCLCRLRGERPESGDQYVRAILNKLHGQWRKSLRPSFGGSVFESQ